jgi:hypothetical protein
MIGRDRASPWTPPDDGYSGGSSSGGAASASKTTTSDRRSEPNAVPPQCWWRSLWIEDRASSSPPLLPFLLRLPSVGSCLRVTLGITVALYVLNERHLLPRRLSAAVSSALFWPTLPITAAKRIGRWQTPIDDTVVMGGAPFAFLRYPEKLYYQFGVRALWALRACVGV